MSTASDIMGDPAGAAAQGEQKELPTIAIGNEGGVVFLVFNQTVDHVGMSPEASIELARSLCEHAVQAGLQGHAFVMQSAAGNFAAQLAEVQPAKTFADVVAESQKPEAGPEGE